jgi:hypothetical protein
MMKKILSVVCAFVLLGAGSVSAQRIDSPYRFLDHSQFVGVYGGQTWMPDGQLSLGPASAMTAGARWALRVSGPFAISADVGYTPTTRPVRDTVFVAADSLYRQVGEADVKLLSVLASLRISLMGARTWNGLHPFVEVGGGAVVDLAGASAAEADLPADVRVDFGTSFAGVAGAGIEWFASDRLSFRVDARNVLWKLSVPEAFLFAETSAERRIGSSVWGSNYSLTAGLSIHF